jgi:hypothetical protein
MSWLDLLSDDKPIRSIFGETIPTLEGADLHEVSLHHDGPRVMLRFDLADFPKTPPRKWVIQGANTVQLELMLLGTEDLEIRGWSTKMGTHVSMFRHDDGSIVVDIDSDSFHFHVRSAIVLVHRISGHLDTASP